MSSRTRFTIRSLGHIYLLCSALVLMSCTSWRAEYLEEVKGRANQDAVTIKLGPPMGERTLSNGDAVWIYRYSGAAVGESGGGTWCKEYLLRFDSKKILRDWNRQKC